MRQLLSNKYIVYLYSSLTHSSQNSPEGRENPKLQNKENRNNVTSMSTQRHTARYDGHFQKPTPNLISPH